MTVFILFTFFLKKDIGINCRLIFAEAILELKKQLLMIINNNLSNQSIYKFTKQACEIMNIDKYIVVIE